MTKRGQKQFIYIDDSGKPDFWSDIKNDYLVMGAVVFNSRNSVDKAHDELLNITNSFNWHNKYKELKFHRLIKRNKIEILNKINTYNFKIYAVYLLKDTFRSSPPDKELYEKLLHKLLELIPLQDFAHIRIDRHDFKKSDKEAISYLRKDLSAHRLNIKFEDSHKDLLIQLADLVTGAIAHSLKTTPDHNIYINLIKSHISLFDEPTL